MTRTLKRKRYISHGEIKLYCPRVQLVREFEPGMKTYEITHDKLPEFFRENNVTKIVMKKEYYERTGPIQLESCTTVMIKCKVENDEKA
jgi:hypothetical protein